MKPERGDTVGETLARGTVLFMGVELHAEPGALVPRLETELLGETAARVLADRGAKRVVDMCCGAGNLACGVASRLVDLEIFAADLTTDCVTTARRNVDKLGLGARVHVHQGDLFAAFDGLGLEGTLDAVICNPPYISTARLEGDRSFLVESEPREAFDGGPYGIAIHQRVTKDALAFLKPDGVLLFEIGAGQAKQVTILLQRARQWSVPTSVSNEDGEPRVLWAIKKASQG